MFDTRVSDSILQDLLFHICDVIQSDVTLYTQVIRITYKLNNYELSLWPFMSQFVILNIVLNRGYTIWAEPWENVSCNMRTTKVQISMRIQDSS